MIFSIFLVLGSDLLLGLQNVEGVFCPDVGVDARVVERIGMLLLLLRRICPGTVGNGRSWNIDMSSWVSDKLDESSSSSSLFISSLGVFLSFFFFSIMVSLSSSSKETELNIY